MIILQSIGLIKTGGTSICCIYLIANICRWGVLVPNTLPYPNIEFDLDWFIYVIQSMSSAPPCARETGGTVPLIVRTNNRRVVQWKGSDQLKLLGIKHFSVNELFPIRLKAFKSSANCNSRIAIRVRIVQLRTCQTTVHSNRMLLRTI